MKSVDKRSIDLEDLLRLKRAERPAPEFWATFDRQLRAKQLAALVAKRPWWNRLPAGLASLSRYRLPLGAAAVLGVSFISFHESSNLSSSAGPDASLARSYAEAATIVAASGQAEVGAAVNERQPELMPRIESFAAKESVTTPDVEAKAAEHVIAPAMGSRADVTFAAAGPFPSNQHVVEAATNGGTFSTSGLLTGGFESRVSSGRQAVDPLMHLTLPGERNRSRLITAMVSMASTDNAARTSERQARQISQERLYDQINRFDARGAGVKISF